MSIITPVASAVPDADDNLWKYMQLRTTGFNFELSLSHSMAYNGTDFDDGDSKANVEAPINTTYSTFFNLAFTLQNSQRARLEVFKLSDTYSFTDEPGKKPIDEMWRATSGAVALAEHDPRGELVGYLYGEYNATGEARVFDGEDGDDDAAEGVAQKFFGFTDPDAPDFMKDLRGLPENVIQWTGLVSSSSQTKPFLLGEYDEQDTCYVIAIQPLSAGGQSFLSFLPIIINSTALEDWSTEELCDDENSGEASDPVSLITGSLKWSYTDIALYGSEALEFIRSYNSRDTAVNALGKGWRHNYEYKLEVHPLYTTVVLPSGYKMTFSLRLDGGFTSPDNSGYILESAGNGYVLTKWDKTQFAFNQNGELESIVNLNGETTTFGYANGKLNSIANKTGTLYLNYQGDKLISVSDDTNRTVTFTYNGDYLASAINTDNDSLIYTYNQSGYLSQIENFNGEIYLQNWYDEDGCVTEQYLVGEGTSYFNYDFVNRSGTHTSPNGEVTTYYYNRNKKITAVETSLGTTRYTFNEAGNLSSVTDRLNNTTYYSYVGDKNRSKVEFPDGTSESYVYNDLNLVTEHINRAGGVIQYGYDARGNLTSYTDPKENISSFTYDADNNLTLACDALGNETSYTYDAKGNCLTETDPLGNITSYEYDNQGRLVLQVFADGSEVAYEYTTAGKLVKTTDPDGNEYSYTVNGNGFDEGSADPMGNETSTVYNEQNRPISVTDAGTSVHNDKLGNTYKIKVFGIKQTNITINIAFTVTMRRPFRDKMGGVCAWV